MTPTQQDPVDEEIINQFRTAKGTESGVYDQTVGYGEKYPQEPTTHLVIDETNRATGIHHQHRGCEKGYDLTRFGDGAFGARRFIQLVQSTNLDPIDDFRRVYRDLGDGYPPYWLYIWVNDKLMIATTANPINGDSSSQNTVGKEGYAGYIGVGGKTTPVLKATTELETLAESIKDKNENGLFY